MDIVYQFAEEIQYRIPNLYKWQAFGLSLLTCGIIQTRSSRVNEIAEQLAAFGTAPSVSRRLRRWVSNKRIEVVDCCAAWMKWVWDSYTDDRVILLVDETKLSDRLGIMMVALAYERRAIPLVWRVYKANSAADYPAEGQVEMIMKLLHRVYDTLPPGKQVIVQADRGISHSSAFIRALEKAGYAYLLRVKAAATFYPETGGKYTLGDMLKPGQSLTMTGGLFGRDKQCPVTLMATWQSDQKDPWFLISPVDSDVDMMAYGQRVWQEQAFRDLKSGGWRWNYSFITSPERASRLLFALVIAYGWMLTQGTFVMYSGANIQRMIYHGKNPRYSIFRQGLRYFRYFCHHKPTRIIIGMFFAPRQLLC